MDLLATGTTVTPGLPARTGDAASDGEKRDESAIFEAFLGLALTVPSPGAAVVSGPEGEGAPGDVEAAGPATGGNPAMPGGKILPVVLPASLPVSVDGADAMPNVLPEGEQVATPPPSPPQDDARPANDTPRPVVVAGANGAPVPRPEALEAITPQTALAKPADPLADRQAAGRQPAEAPPQAAPRPASTAPEAALAMQAAPVARLLADRQRPAPQDPAARPAIAATEASPAEDGPLPIVAQPTAASTPVRPEAPRPTVTGTSTPPTGTDRPARAVADADLAPTPVAPQLQAEPLASLTEARPAAPTGTSAASPQPAPAQSPAHQFGDIVDRLVRAREAEQPGLVQSHIATRDFGMVSMQMRTVEGRLHVSLAAADPSFAPAVQAASAVGGAGQQALSDNSAQNQSQGQQQGQTGQQSGQGMAAQDNPARRQAWDRSVENPVQGRPSAGSDDEDAPLDRGGRTASGAIYA
jgi:hypothetical protein